MRAPVVTIDGPVGSGKSTVGQLLAERCGFLCLDSGLFYRAAALAARRAGADPGDAGEVVPAIANLELEFRPETEGAYRTRVLSGGEDVTEGVYSAEVEAIVSDVSRLPEVRAHLLGEQRRVIGQGGVVALGRDIGTVVWPEAELKVYLDAPLETRALRKWGQRRADGECIDLASVRHLLETRDRIDSTRVDAPLAAASDAVRIDSADCSPANVVAQIEAILRERGLAGGCCDA
ncbi:MAG: (d)CMP kinase [Chloroflexi bacterium]|nr:(d)CMP kinase [Chloroflexota bacterium]